MAIVNTLGNLGKDSSWLQLEVCREYQRQKCSRPDTECKFAHPPSTVDIQNGRVIACYDSIKGRCNREKPPCKYFHPPQHLKDQLLINGRNHLALKQAFMQTQLPHMPLLGVGGGGQLPVGGICPPVPPPSAASILAAFAGPTRMHHVARLQRRKEVECRVTNSPAGHAIDTYHAALRKQAASNAYVASLPAMAAAQAAAAYGTYPLTFLPGLMTADHLTNHFALHVPPAISLQQPTNNNHSKLPGQRTDRLEICREFKRGNCKRPDSDCRYAHPPEHVQLDSNDGLVTVCMDFIKGRCSRDSCRYMHPPPHLQAQLKAKAAAATANAANDQLSQHSVHMSGQSAAAAAAAAHLLPLTPLPSPTHPAALTLAAAAASTSRPYRL